MLILFINFYTNFRSFPLFDFKWKFQTTIFKSLSFKLKFCYWFWMLLVVIVLRHSCLLIFACWRVVLHFLDLKKLLQAFWIWWCLFANFLISQLQNAFYMWDKIEIKWKHAMLIQKCVEMFLIQNFRTQNEHSTFRTI